MLVIDSFLKNIYFQMNIKYYNVKSAIIINISFNY
jgi:hypothetical protein